MAILVTGGAGFIGTNFVYHLVGEGRSVVVYDKLTYAGGRDNLTPLGKKVDLILGDVCDRQTVRQALGGISQVVHFAAESHNTRSETDPELFYRTNLEGTRVMLEEAFHAKVKRFLYVSTDEVYGPTLQGRFQESDKAPGATLATSAYAKSKALADDLATTYGQRGYPVIVIRPTNNFGPWQFPEKALPRWLTNLLTGQKVPLWGEGEQVRDWLYAPVCAQAIAFLLEQGKEREAYNVAAGHKPEVTNRQIAAWMCQILKLDPQEWIQFIPDPRPDHDFRYALDTTKLTALGWQPAIDLPHQLTQTVRWYKLHGNWWQKRKAEAERIYQ